MGWLNRRGRRKLGLGGGKLRGRRRLRRRKLRGGRYLSKGRKLRGK